jgi:hypothetical protein
VASRRSISFRATAQGHKIIEWQIDLDEPGTRYERPGFQAARRTPSRSEMQPKERA